MIPNLTKDMIDLMQQLRKRIRAEFGIELKLSQTDFLDQMRTLAARSQDKTTQTLYARIAIQLGGKPQKAERTGSMENSLTEKSLAEPQLSARRYRGQQILVESPSGQDQKKPERIYRGRVIA